MEKRRPTYEIEAIKLAIGAIDKLAMTVSALRDASLLGFDRAAIVETIVRIERRMFVKSMTTFADPRVWQDVYHVPARGLTLYVKFQGDESPSSRSCPSRRNDRGKGREESSRDYGRP
jgi:motility quorum-sensing regulator/GCU-specific mRNA interferase toxin